MTQKHTPGPWEIGFSQINAGKHDCIVQFGFNIRENPKAYANAALIAAAPDLLEALKALSRIVTNSELAFTPENVTAQTLIAKVEGK